MENITTTLLLQQNDALKVIQKAAVNAATKAVEEALKLLSHKDWIKEHEAMEYLGATNKVALRRKAKEVGIITSNVGNRLLYHQGSIDAYIESRSSDSIKFKY